MQSADRKGSNPEKHFCISFYPGRVHLIPKWQQYNFPFIFMCLFASIALKEFKRNLKEHVRFRDFRYRYTIIIQPWSTKV